MQNIKKYEIKLEDRAEYLIKYLEYKICMLFYK